MELDEELFHRVKRQIGEVTADLLGAMDNMDWQQILIDSITLAEVGRSLEQTAKIVILRERLEKYE